jgi:hypothetical protein
MRRGGLRGLIRLAPSRLSTPTGLVRKGEAGGGPASGLEGSPDLEGQQQGDAQVGTAAGCLHSKLLG